MSQKVVSGINHFAYGTLYCCTKDHMLAPEFLNLHKVTYLVRYRSIFKEENATFKGRGLLSMTLNKFGKKLITN
jgi:hypothetical protein